MKRITGLTTLAALIAISCTNYHENGTEQDAGVNSSEISNTDSQNTDNVQEACEKVRYCVDFDGDSYHTGGPKEKHCRDAQPQYFIECAINAGQVDCNDKSKLVNPGVEEKCNGYDDNCKDGADEKEKVERTEFCEQSEDDVCASVRLVQCVDGKEIFGVCGYIISPEICNDVDDDCNGEVDDGLTTKDGFKKGELCYSSSLGDCIGEAYAACNDAGELVCDTSFLQVSNKPEVCNGIDDNCKDGVDEGTDEACQNECHQGIRYCIDGKLTECDAPGITEEDCTKEGDENCDGVDGLASVNNCQNSIVGIVIDLSSSANEGQQKAFEAAIDLVENHWREGDYAVVSVFSSEYKIFPATNNKEQILEYLNQAKLVQFVDGTYFNEPLHAVLDVLTKPVYDSYKKGLLLFSDGDTIQEEPESAHQVAKDNDVTVCGFTPSYKQPAFLVDLVAGIGNASFLGTNYSQVVAAYDAIGCPQANCLEGQLVDENFSCTQN